MGFADNSKEFNRLSMNHASQLTTQNDIANKIMYLSSKSKPTFRIQIDAKTIQACEILKNVSKFTPDSSDAIEVDMSPKQLCKFVELHEHFSIDDPWDKEEPEWVCKFFGKFSDSEFKEFCWKADYLDSERFLNNAAIYLHKKLDGMDVKQIRKFLNIIDDYTDAEKSAMDKCHFKYFVNLVSQNEFLFCPQNFAFPKSFINFAFSASKIQCDIKKLYKTCKYFFGISKLIRCQKLSVFNGVSLYDGNENVKFISYEDMDKFNANIFGLVHFSLYGKRIFQECPQFLKKIIRPEISVAMVDCKDLKFTLEEFKFLFSKVDKFSFYHAEVIDIDGSEVPVEELLNCLPKVTTFYYINFSPNSFTKNSMQKMTVLNRGVKLHHFYSKISKTLKISENEFDLFVKNHAKTDVEGTTFHVEDRLGITLFKKIF